MQQDELTAKEANAILYTENRIRKIGVPKVEYPQTPDAHYIRISHLYVKMYILISHCLDVCGMHELTVIIYFQNNFFHF